MGLRPDWRVTVGGRDLTPDLRPHLSELRVETAAGQTGDRVELALADEAGVLAIPSSGRALSVDIGYEGALVRMGDFVHVETELQLLPRRWTVRGTGTDFHAGRLKARRTRSWDDVTVGAVVMAIADDHEHQAAVDEALAGEVIAHIDQTAESDLHLLRRLARHYDAIAKVADGVVLFSRAGAGTAASGAEVSSIVVRPPGPRGETVSGRVSLSDRSMYGAVRASYWDVEQAMLVHVTAGDGTPVSDLPEPRPDRAQAEADAAARLRALTRRTATLDLSMPGDPSVVAGGIVEMAGWGAPVDGRWVTNRVSHRLDGSTGYVTDLTAEMQTV